MDRLSIVPGNACAFLVEAAKIILCKPITVICSFAIPSRSLREIGCHAFPSLVDHCAVNTRTTPNDTPARPAKGVQRGMNSAPCCTRAIRITGVVRAFDHSE